MKTRIALIGGSFDPPHTGHVIMIKNLLLSGLADEVWISPTGVRQSKKTTANPLQRFVMTELMVNTEFGAEMPIFVLDYRTLRNDSYPTIELLEFLEDKYTDREFYLVIGSDLIDKLEGWHRGEELIQKKKFIVVPRTELEIQAELPYNFTILGHELRVVGYSSTKVRKKIKTSEDLEQLIPPTVRAYITRYALYK